MADAILPISEAARLELLDLAPSASARATTAHLAVAPDRWPALEVDRRSDQVVTVGFVDEVSWTRKGVDRYLELAASDPTRRYVLAGRIAPTIALRLERSCTPNVQLTGFLRHDELVELLWTSGVYVQLSRHEGFGLSVAEAMACGCVPVVSDLPALREVVGNWGVIADGDAPGAIESACSMAVDRDAMRSDVLRRFSPARRQLALEAVVDLGRVR